MLRSRRGSAIPGLVNIVVLAIIAVIIGLVVVSTLLGLNTTALGFSSQAQDIWNTLANNVWTVFTLIVIIPIIVVASVFMGIFKGGGRR